MKAGLVVSQSSLELQIDTIMFTSEDNWVREVKSSVAPKSCLHYMPSMAQISCIHVTYLLCGAFY